MSTFVLIVSIWTYGSNGGNAVAMQEFTSLERCNAARAVVTEKNWAGAAAVCVPK